MSTAGGLQADTDLSARRRGLPQAAGPGSRLGGFAAYLLLALSCYVPMLLTKPGVVSDDTKTYLYLDPGSLLRNAVSMWDPGVALGTVTHQNIGYLFPMGPFFYVFSGLHAPIWVAQRLWLGSIMFAAAAGMLYLCRLFHVDGLGRVVAALAYGLSPYVLQYAGRISVILLPFSGLPWLVALMVLALRRGGWRYPALFALVLFAVSGINASSVAYVVVAPLLWLPYAVFVRRERTVGEALVLFGKTAFLSILVSLWWIAGLSVEAIYGVDILKYTETVQAASSSASASEVIRGLGYWYFYNGDRIGLWTESSIEYTTSLKLLLLSYAVPVGACLSAALVRWRERAYFVIVLVVGLALSVGSNPFSAPTPLGAVAKAFMTSTTAGEALRSTDRATPLVILALAVLLGAGVKALVRKFRAVGWAAGWLSVAAVLAAAAPLIGGDSVITQFSQPAKPPGYVEAAAKYLNSHSTGTRVYDLPGDDFAAYDYGDTIDPIWAAVLTRPFVTHEQFIQGSMPTANLLYAIDNPLQQGTMDFRALAPVARLMSAGDVLVEYDEQYARYNSPRPALVLNDLRTVPPGLRGPVWFGVPQQNKPSLPMYDETYFDLPSGIPYIRPLAVYSVADPLPIYRADSLTSPLVIAGDDVGVVEAADAGLLAHNPTILFSGTLDEDPALERQVLAGHPELVVTDSNRKQAFEWNSLSENTGYTETASEAPSAFVANDPEFDLFPEAGTGAMTTSVLKGISSVTASSYGTSFTLRSEWRPANAIDGNVRTAWETEGTVDSPLLGQWWQVTAEQPVSADSVTLVQPLPQRNASYLTNQYVTKATITFDGKDPVTVNLGPQSRTAAGEVFAFSSRRFRTLRVTIDRTNLLSRPSSPSPVGASLVGLAEVRVGNLRATQIISMPSDLLSHAGTASLGDRLVLIMTRERVAPVPPRMDPEQAIVRQFALPTPRTFSLAGTARLSNLVPDNAIDSLVGRTDALVVSATSSSRMPGNLYATASDTLDGNPSTVWMPGIGKAADVGSWLQYRLRRPLTIDHLALTISSDAEHSRPTEVLVSAGGVTRAVQIPTIPVTPRAGSVTTVQLHFPAIAGTVVRLTFAKVKARNTLSYETSLETELPIGIAEVSIPGVPLEHLPRLIPALCRSNLLRVDGRPVPVEVSGTTKAALDGDGLEVSLCGSARGGISLPAGTNLLQAADGSVSGIDLDQLALDSAPGGGPMALPGNGLLAPVPMASAAGAPAVTVVSKSATSATLRIGGATKPFMLVLGESLNNGWRATVSGGGALTDHVLVDGFANGWVVTPGRGGVPEDRSFVVDLSFAPQEGVDLALVLSAVAVLLCLAIVAGSVLASRRRVRDRRRRRPGGGRRRALGTGLDPAAGVLDGRTGSLATSRASWPAERASIAADPELDLAVVAPVAVPSRRVAIGGVLLALACGLAFAGTVDGIVCGIVALVALSVARARRLLSLAAAGAMIVGALVVVGQEALRRYVPGGGWAAHFAFASSIVWLAVVLLAADAGWQAISERRAARLVAGAARPAGETVEPGGALDNPDGIEAPG